MSTELETVRNDENRVAAQHGWRRPRYRVTENGEAFLVDVSMPGVNRNGLDISLDGESLGVTGTRAATPEGWRPLHRELAGGDYRLELRLNVPVDEDKIRAEMAEGMLRLTLPKADAVKPRKIKVG